MERDGTVGVSGGHQTPARRARRRRWERSHGPQESAPRPMPQGELVPYPVAPSLACVDRMNVASRAGAGAPVHVHRLLDALWVATVAGREAERTRCEAELLDAVDAVETS